MPIYTFKCPSCNHIEEYTMKMNEKAPLCTKCTEGPSMSRVWKDTGKPQFKGTGFYETDYKFKKN